ncbi:MAG: hypothetical protein AAF942_11945, partial [Pseudomonadota bacterium]
YDALWTGLRPLCMSAPFVEGFTSLRGFAEEAVVALDPPPISSRLVAQGYGAREISAIGETVEVFSHGNFPYLTLATSVRLLMEGEAFGGNRDAAPAFDGRHAPDISVPFVLMEAHHADTPTQEVYRDVMKVLGLPFVNTDYRAFARWPSYWATAWSDLRPAVSSPIYEEICQSVHARVVEIARALPNPGGLTSETLHAAAAKDASFDEVRDVCRLFQWLLPGLVVNVAFLRAQLRDGG